MTLNIVYVTNRKDNLIKWFFDSLNLQLKGNYDGIKIIVVDFFAQIHGDMSKKKVELRKAKVRSMCKTPNLVHVAPMGNVWQGPHRLTQRDYFDAANSRNTAICHAEDGYIAFVDDLSVLLPGWIDRVRAAVAGNYIVFGTYQKVQNLVVEDGAVKSFTETTHGLDHRIAVVRKLHAHLNEAPTLVKCNGSWLFGCSFGAPIDRLLAVNGMDLDTGSMSYEDTSCGSMLQQQGFDLYFDTEMKTLESEEHHFIETPFLRIDKANVMGKKDASNAYVAMLLGGRKRAPNYYGEEGLAGVRKRVLAGEPMPVIQCPDRDWRDGKLLSEM